MQKEFEAMKVSRNYDQILFTVQEGINNRVISDMKLLEAQDMVVLSWSTNLESRIHGRWTRKGMDLRNYLKQHEWD
ncbi:hypothetical protein [Dyadobacter sediminis]|uniref:Uncharacterized protein n=1 Tax=Dyadobacter sediminis TaxID=1493691 RepID=A0A5R9KQB8_9BACT|nr:hypothetical protein [Dyadobacter sediminis]TLU98357.1 hypothetical protein FEM55_00320 [Dyadobacter sediminis]GGC14638.1 hypothetical protein GCM10011325_46880 [Dyadobacter sediminis]